MKRIILALLLLSDGLLSMGQTPTITSFIPATGPVGTLVTITGTNLTAPTALTVGGMSAIAVSNTGSSLVAMVMPGAVTGTVTLTTAGGTATSSSNFTVTATAVANTQLGNKLLATNSVGQAMQGWSVGISADGNTAIVGGAYDNGSVGAAWIYTRSGTTWTQQAKLVGSGNIGRASQGWTVAINADGNTAAIAGTQDNANVGAIWVFARNGTAWTQQSSKLIPTDLTGTAGIGYGLSLSADGNTLVIGAPGDNNLQGAVWVYGRSGGNWTQMGNKLVGAGNSGAARQGLSVAISADGNTFISGAITDNGTVGASWVFTRSGNSWTQQGNKLVGTGGTGNVRQGSAVSLSADGNTAMIGGSSDNNDNGAVWVFTRSAGTWTQQGNKITGTGTAVNSELGYSVSLSADGNSAMVGADYDNNGVGAVWLFTRSGGIWSQQGNKLVGTGGVGASQQGNAVALSADGNTAFEAGNYDNTYQGAAWVFTYAYKNINLSSLTLSSGSLSPAFDTAVTSYTVSVPFAISSLTVTPTLADAGATVAVRVNNGSYTAVTSGNASGSLALNVGINTINIRVISADGTMTKIYTLTVTRPKGDQVITFNALPNHTYGDAPFSLTATGGGSGNAVTYTSSNPAVATVSGNTVTVLAVGSTTITANQAGNTNYNAATAVAQMLTIDPRAITVTATAKNKTYGSTDPALTYTFTPALIGADAFTGALNRVVGENVGAYLINQNTLALSSNYSINYTAADLTIGAKAITVTAATKSKIYGGADPTLTYTFTPALIGADAFTGVLNRTAGENVGAYLINQNTLTLSSNYTINYTGANLTISAKSITVTATAQSKTYGDVDPALTYTFSPALISGDAFTGSLNRVSGENVGRYVINQNTLTPGNNYNVSYNSANLTISAKNITVTVDAQSKTYGDADPAFTYTFSPALISGDAFTGSLNRVIGENVGTYTINQNTLALSNNYNISYNNANLAIGAKTVTVTVNAQSKTYGDVDPAFTYTFVPALITGDAFTGALSRVAGEDVGAYMINQNTLALSNNYIVNYTGADLTISTKTITVTATAQHKIYGDTDPALTYTFTPALVSGDAFTGALSRVAGEDVGAYMINQNTLALSNNYIVNYTGADLTISTRTITVTATAQHKTYGDTDPALTYTFTPALVSGDAFTGALSRVAGEDVGAYIINQNTLALSNNYIVNYTNASLVIGAKTITITADAQRKTYGDTDPALTYTFTPALVSGDVFTGSLNRVAGENVGTYSINQNTLGLSNNYDVNYNSANLIIGAKTITVTADAKSKTYGDVDPVLTYTFSPALIAGDGFTGSLNRNAGEDAGTYQINQHSLALNNNYTISFASGLLRINSANQNIDFTALADKLSTDGTFALNATATSGFSVSYTSSDPNIARIINNNEVEILGAGTVMITASQDGNADYNVATPVSQQLIIIENPVPIITIESDRGTNISKGETAALTAGGAESYAWSAADGIISGENTAVLTVRPSVTTTYTVTGTNQYGRNGTQTFTLTVKDDINELVPTNIVSPNGDGINDYWTVKNIDLYPNNEVKIYDRAGRMIYYKKGYDNSWGGTANGQPLFEGTYYYFISFGDGVGMKKGFITIVR